jgi:hypothetical protein
VVRRHLTARPHAYAWRFSKHFLNRDREGADLFRGLLPRVEHVNFCLRHVAALLTHPSLALGIGCGSRSES